MKVRHIKRRTIPWPDSWYSTKYALKWLAPNDARRPKALRYRSYWK